MRLDAKSGDAEFLQRIESSSFSGFVHSIFDRTINIQCFENGELYTIACSQLDNGPNTLVVDRKRFHDAGLAVHDQVMVREKTLLIGNKLAISIEQAKEWECLLPAYPSDITILNKNVTIMKEYVAAHGKTGGMKMASQPASVFEAEVTNLLVSRSGKLRNELAASRWAEAYKQAIGLVGLGPGLTPSGDDFLTGLFSIYNMQNIPCCLPCHFFEDITNSSKNLTNEISCMMVKKAAIGQVRESIVSLLHSLTGGTREEVVLSLGNVLSIGSSSGTDMALGLICGLELNMEAGGNVCLPKL